MIINFQAASNIVNKYGGRGMSETQLEVIFGGKLPAIVTGCRYCGRRGRDAAWSQLYYISLKENPGLLERANRPPFAGVVSGGVIPYTAITECLWCNRCAPLMEVVK